MQGSAPNNMDPYWNKNKRSSISAGTPFSQTLSNDRFAKPPLPLHTSPSPAPSLYRSSHYDSVYPIYYCDWASTDRSLVALSSYREDMYNRIQVIHGFPEKDEQEEEFLNFFRMAETTVNYPVSKLQWDPSIETSTIPRLATSSECLRIYEARDNRSTTGKPQLVEKATLANGKTKDLNELPPLTSFDWCKCDSSQIITSSLDTTCTLWDVTKGVAKTQLIAHDSEVFDVQFLHGNKHIFASCGNDGSMRVFDLRSLDHSTIVYEPQPMQMNPLLRLSASNYNANQVAAVEEKSNKVLVLDLRYPGVAWRTLQHHSASVNSVKWHPYKNMLMSGADDCQVLIYDMNNAEREPRNSDKDELPSMAHTDEESEVNNVTWSGNGLYVGYVAGKGFQAVRVE